MQVAKGLVQFCTKCVMVRNSFDSRGLDKSERNYSASHLEFLSLNWAVTEKLFVCTHNNPLTYVLTTAKLDATGHPWLASLAAYDFDIVYRPGRSNANYLD